MAQIENALYILEDGIDELTDIPVIACLAQSLIAARDAALAGINGMTGGQDFQTLAEVLQWVLSKRSDIYNFTTSLAEDISNVDTNIFSINAFFELDTNPNGT